MTAKEITEKCYSPLMGKYVFDDEDLQAYADALCKEQIESCHLAWTKASRDQNVEAESILTAPQPEAL